MPATLASYAVETLGLLLPALALVAAWWVLRSKATPMEAGAGLDGLLGVVLLRRAGDSLPVGPTGG